MHFLTDQDRAPSMPFEARFPGSKSHSEGRDLLLRTSAEDCTVFKERRKKGHSDVGLFVLALLFPSLLGAASNI